MTLKIKFSDGATQESFDVERVSIDGHNLRVYRKGRERAAAFPLHTISYAEWRK